MKLYALISVDLENYVTSEQRKKFNEKLKELKWFKIIELTTIWTASFEDGITKSSALSTTKADVATAAKEGKISKYHAAVQFGYDSSDTFSNN